MSQQWAREEARARAKARRLQAKPKLTVIPETERAYKSPITYTRLQYMQNIARAQNTNYNDEFLPEGEVTDVLEGEWFLILDEAFRIFDGRLVCGKCGTVHDMGVEGVRLQYLRLEMEEADPEYIREVDVDKWSEKFEDIEERYTAELKTSKCWREELPAVIQMPARAFPTTKSQLVIQEALARKPKTRKALFKTPKEAEIWRQEALASKATNPKTRVFPSAKTSTQKAPAKKTTLKTPGKTLQTTKASTRKDLARERIAREIPAEKSKTVELWRQEVLTSIPIGHVIPKAFQAAEASADNGPAWSAKTPKSPAAELSKITETRRFEALARTPITQNIPKKASLSSTARDLARERMTFEIPAEDFHTVDVPGPRQIYPPKITAEDIMAGDSCSEFSWEEALDDDDDKHEVEVKEAFVEDAKMEGAADKVSMEDLLTEVEDVLPSDVDMSEILHAGFNADDSLERELENAFAVESPRNFDHEYETSTQSLMEDIPAPRVAPNEIPGERLPSSDSLERELEDAFVADKMDVTGEVSTDEIPAPASEGEQEEMMVVYYSSSEESEEE